MRKYPNIDEIDRCPHCESDFGYFQRYFMSGWVNDIHLFKRGDDGERMPYNSEMFDGLYSGKVKKEYFCVECKKRIA